MKYKNSDFVKPKLVNKLALLEPCKSCHVTSASSTPDGPADRVVIRMTFEGGSPDTFYAFYSPEQMDSFIEGMVSARNAVWPSE